MLAHWRTNWVSLRTCIAEVLVDRADFALVTLFRFLPIITQILLWRAIFAVGTSAERDDIEGYGFRDMVAYYLLAMVARAFSSMPGLASGIARDVRDGQIKKYLTQPIDLLGYLFWHRIAHKLVYYVVATGPFVLVFWLCRDYFPGWPDAFTIAGFCVALVLAFLLGFLIEALIGQISFWFLEVSSLLFIYMMFNYFLSGHMIPLDLLPGAAGAIVQYLPFKYLAYTPAAIMLGRYTHPELVHELTLAGIWIVALFVTNRIAFARGVKRYGAFGG